MQLLRDTRKARTPRSPIDSEGLSNDNSGLLHAMDGREFTGCVPDAIVIGAGVVGAATAHALAGAGMQVVVLDGGHPAGGASAATFGVDITRVKTPRVLFELSSDSGLEHAALQREFDDVAWRHPAATLEWEDTSRDQQRLRNRVQRLHAWGYPAEWLIPQRVTAIEPALGQLGTAAEVAFYRGGCWYEPAVFVRSLLERAQQLGAAVHLGDPVTAMSTVHGWIIELRTGKGRRLSADVVVNCAGAQAVEVAALAGATLPLQRVPGLIVTTTAGTTRLRTILAAPDLNIRPHVGDRVMLHSWLADRDVVGATERRRRALGSGLLDRARTLLPGLAHATVQSAAVGVRPIPPDGLPVVGFLPGVANFYTVVSHSAVHLAPILGRLAASELTGLPQPRRLDPFRPTRFRSGAAMLDALDENTRTMLERIDPTLGKQPTHAV